MKLEPLMTFRAQLKTPVSAGKGPLGTRTIFDTIGGRAEGARLSGKVLASGGDWILLDDKGTGRLDVRATVETDDGAIIYVQYFGVLEMNEKVMQGLASGKGTDYGDTYYMIQPRLETGDERYDWVNRIVTVGEGRMLPNNAVEYRVFEVVNG